MMAATQRPVSVAALTEQATQVGWRNVPTWYLVSENDRAISPEVQHFMASRMKAATTSVDGSHVAFIAHPDTTARLISEAVGSLA